MQERYIKWWTPYLSREFEMLIFGSGRGLPVTIFPTSFGRYHQNKDFGLVDSVASFVDNDRVTVYCPDSIDLDSFYNKGIHPADRIRTHIAYENVIVHDVFDFARREASTDRVAVCGASLGAYHAANIAFRHPDAVSLLISLSGSFDISDFFHAFSALTENAPEDFHLLVIGDGPERSELEDLQARCPNVTWMRYCTDSLDLARYYRAADLFVHPGTQETFGLVALESQACGTPVVGIRGSYMDRIILHDQESWAEEDTSESLARTIEAACSRNLPRLGARASRLAEERLSWPRVFERLFAIYQDVSLNYKKQR